MWTCRTARIPPPRIDGGCHGELVGGIDGSGAEGTEGYGGADELSRKKQVTRDSLNHLKTGASLDLSKIMLNEGEVKLVTLVLTGRLQIKDVGPLLYLTLNSPEMDLVAATDKFYHLSEVQLRNGNSGAQSPNEVVLLNPPPPLVSGAARPFWSCVSTIHLIPQSI